MKRILLACVAGLGLVSTAVAGDLPKVEGSWPVHVLERNLAEMSFYEDSSRLSCLSRYHCTRLFFEDEVGTRVDIAVKAGRVYRLVCVGTDRVSHDGCDRSVLLNILHPPPRLGRVSLR